MNAEQKRLLDHIDAVSFAAYDTMLFLDTHPHCEQAKEFYDRMMNQRKEALCQYQERYEPLLAEGMCNSDCFSWVMSPWPWERRGC